MTKWGRRLQPKCGRGTAGLCCVTRSEAEACKQSTSGWQGGATLCRFSGRHHTGNKYCSVIKASCISFAA